MDRKEWHRILANVDRDGDEALRAIFDVVATDKDYVTAIQILHKNGMSPMDFFHDNEDIVREITDKAFQQNPEALPVLYFQAVYSYMDKKYSTALDKFRYVRFMEPDFNDTAEMEPQLLFYNQQYSEAINSIESALEDTPNDELYRSMLAYCFLRTGQIEKMEEEKQRAIDLGGLNEDASKAILMKCVPPKQGRDQTPE